MILAFCVFTGVLVSIPSLVKLNLPAEFGILYACLSSALIMLLLVRGSRK